MKSIIIKTLAAMTAYISLISPISVFAEEEGTAAEAQLEIGEDVVIDHSFNNNSIGKWLPFGGGRIIVNEETGHSEGQSIKITGREHPYDGPSYNCDALFIPGEAYSFDGWIHHEGEQTETFSWTIRTRDKYGTDTFTQIVSADIEPGEWISISGDAVIPEDAVSSLIYIECGNEQTDFSIDDILVKGNVSEANDSVVSEFEDKYIMDFEKDFDQWVARGELTIAHTDEYSFSGDYSIYVTNRTKEWNGPTVSVSDKVIKGNDYYYSAYVMYNGEEYGDSHGFRMEIQYTIDGNITYNLISSKNVKKGKWTKIEGYYNIPVEAENAYVYIQTDNLEEGVQLTKDDTMSFYADNVSICKAEVKKKEQITRNIIIGAFVVIVLAVIFFIASVVRRRYKKKSEALELVSLDAMTRVYNRNTYEKRISELESEGEKYKSLYFALCDVNFLKFINDTYGHKKGDEAIIRCAEILKRIIGEDGGVYRIGGDEFVCISEKEFKEVLLAETEKESAVDKGYPFEIACGFAQYDAEKYPAVKDIVNQCDKEMYVHKQEIKARNKEFSRK